MRSNVSADSVMIVIITNKPIASNIVWNQNRENPPRFTLMFFCCFFFVTMRGQQVFFILIKLWGVVIVFSTILYHSNLWKSILPQLSSNLCRFVRSSSNTTNDLHIVHENIVRDFNHLLDRLLMFTSATNTSIYFIYLCIHTKTKGTNRTFDQFTVPHYIQYLFLSIPLS